LLCAAAIAAAAILALPTSPPAIADLTDSDAPPADLDLDPRKTVPDVVGVDRRPAVMPAGPLRDELERRAAALRPRLTQQQESVPLPRRRP
jgi:hypothetical protein